MTDRQVPCVLQRGDVLILHVTEHQVVDLVWHRGNRTSGETVERKTIKPAPQVVRKARSDVRP